MLTNLIKKEIVGHVLSLRFVLTFVLFSVLLLTSVLLLSADYQARQHIHEASKVAHRELLTSVKGVEDQDERFYDLVIGGGGWYGDRAPQPLSIYVQGLDDDIPVQVNSSAWGAIRRIDERFYSNPLETLFAAPDYYHIVNIVVSLLSLLFAFDTICGEKERGTLKLVLANAVPRDLVLLSKWIGGYLSLALPFLVAVLASVTYVYFAGTIRLDDGTIERLLCITAVSLLYASLFFALGMMISTCTHKASTALLVSLFVWGCWVLIIPNLASVVAKMVSPAPSLQWLVAEKKAVNRETQIRQERVQHEMLGEEATKKVAEIRQEGESRMRRLDTFYRDRRLQQIGLSENLSRLSPSASFTYAVTALASTGIGFHSSFRSAYKRFDDEFRDWAGQWYWEFSKGDGKHPDKDWLHGDALPSMKLVATPMADAVSSALMDIVLLLVFNVLLFMLSYLFFLRYDVT